MEIDVFCFQNAEIEELLVPASVERVCAGAFRNCTRLRVIAFTSDSRLLEIEDWAFSACGQLKEVEFPAALERVGPFAVIDCGRLARVAFAAGSRLRVVEASAFADCTHLAVCELPVGVAVGIGAFDEVPLGEVRLEEDEDK